jgi:5-formyltetrahydrofolate cyclo-ligase
MQDEVVSEKARLRDMMKVRRDGLADADGGLAKATAAFGGVVMDLAPPRRGEASPPVISSYLPIGSELDPRPLMRELTVQGAIGALPVIEAKAQPLIFRGYREGDALEEKLWGIREPLATAPIYLPDILVMPLLAFDAEGWRLGFGGGFYDRTLAKLRHEKAVVAVGLAYDEQRVNAVPHDDYDERLDFVLTPSGLKKFQR